MLRGFRVSSFGLRVGRVAVPAEDTTRASPWSVLAGRLVGISRSAVAREAAALGFLAAVVLFSFRDAITSGLVGFEHDTVVFFYPLAVWFAEEFKAGRFPLWNPNIFAGYPSLADGESGLAYPLHLALLRLLSVDQTFIWLRISSVLIAAGSMYAFCRALGTRRGPAVLGGLTFSLGSFFLSQQHHENVTRTAAWLPLVLACTEWALHRAGWPRHLFLTGAGVALAMAALGLHPQVLGMTLLGFSTFVIFRVLTGRIGGNPASATAKFPATGSGPHPNPLPAGWGAVASPLGRLAHGWWEGVRRLALVVWIGGYVGALGLGLASVQLVPLAELGLATYRGSQPDYFFATSYALPVHNLVNLVFPYFFRGPESDSWSLWARWETALYVGIAPLMLGLLAVFVARRREVIYFAVLAVVSLWLAFATYAPYDLYGQLWQLPGFSAFRVPGRYTYLFILAWSVLAAFGLQALLDASRSRARTRVALGMLVALGAGVALLAWGMASLRDSLLADPAAGLTWLERTYLGLRHHPGEMDTVDTFRGLAHSLSFTTPRTAFGLILLSTALLLIGAMAAGRRLAPALQFAIIALAGVDLLVTGVSFHQKMPVGELAERTPAIRFLLAQGAVGGDQGAAAARPESNLRPGGNGGSSLTPERRPLTPFPWRIYTPGESAPSMEFNRLVPFGLEDIGGYSSAEPRDNFAYWTTVRSLENRLLDLANVRYLVSVAQESSLPSYRNVSFDPEQPLMLGSKDSLGGFESYRLGGEPGNRIQVIAGLTRALEIPQGAVVAELRVVPVQGPPVVLPLRAGVHVAEWAYDRPDIAGQARHERPPEIAFRRPDTALLDGRPYNLYFYYSEQDLPDEMRVDRIEIRYVHDRGGIELYGLGLYNFATRQTAAVTQSMRSKLQLAYRDPQVRILENRTAFPRAYVVPAARRAPERFTPLSAMLDSPFDPTREVMLEARDGRPEARGSASGGTPDGRAGEGQVPAAAERLELGADRVAFRAVAPNGGYLVHVATYDAGWHAWVDGQEAPVLKANALFRAVPVPPGEHVVELRYEPLAVSLGLQMTVWAAWGGVAVVLGALLATWLRQRRTNVGDGTSAIQ